MSIDITFDASELRILQRNLGLTAVEFRGRVLTPSINKVASKARTQAKREIAKAGGFRSKYVHDRLNLRRAGAANPTPVAAITASGRYTTLAQFKPSPGFKSGGPVHRAKPWGETRKYHHAFWVRGKNGEAIPVTRTGKKRGDYKTIYGPSVGKEFSRPESMNPVTSQITRDLPVEAARYSKYLMSRL